MQPACVCGSNRCIGGTHTVLAAARVCLGHNTVSGEAWPMGASQTHGGTLERPGPQRCECGGWCESQPGQAPTLPFPAVKAEAGGTNGGGQVTAPEGASTLRQELMRWVHCVCVCFSVASCLVLANN
jgi:hypothetical protein